ncbi:hypothetical protein BS17DRAFT_851375 [Gyrodon lividus]|nr:hypothetical protein BS17DRAFT_851375 [Gyrodon lividus]
MLKEVLLLLRSIKIIRIPAARPPPQLTDAKKTSMTSVSTLQRCIFGEPLPLQEILDPAEERETSDSETTSDCWEVAAAHGDVIEVDPDSANDEDSVPVLKHERYLLPALYDNKFESEYERNEPVTLALQYTSRYSSRDTNSNKSLISVPIDELPEVMQYASSSLTGPSVVEFLPNELLSKIMSHVIMPPSNAIEDRLASSASDPSIAQIDSNSLSAPSRPVANCEKTGVTASSPSERWTSPHGLADIHALCITSRRLYELANTMLYRCVVLKTEKSVLLFARTVGGLVDGAKLTGKSTDVRPRPTLTLEILQSVVKRIAITFVPQLYPIFGFFRPQRKAATKVTVQMITSILSACTGVCTVAVAADWSACLKDIEVPGCASYLDSRGVEEQGLPSRGVCSPSELVLGSYAELVHTATPWPPIPQWRPSPPSTPVPSRQASPARDLYTARPLTAKTPEPTIPFLSNVTHLRIAEPQASLAWHSPVSLLSLFPKLTHVALPRRCNANAENDSVFLEGIKACLQQPAIKMVVVVIFAHLSKDKTTLDDDPAQGDVYAENLEQIKTSSIWESVQELKKCDERLSVVPGSYGSWKREWQSVEALESAAGPGDWWALVGN